MLKSDNKAFSEEKTETIPSGNAILGSALIFKGDITGEEDILIEGSLEGSIILNNNDVSIAPSAKLHANIHARNVVVSGFVQGNIRASGKIVIEESGRMIGDICASRISIMDGAQFKGSMKMSSSG